MDLFGTALHTGENVINSATSANMRCCCRHHHNTSISSSHSFNQVLEGQSPTLEVGTSRICSIGAILWPGRIEFYLFVHINTMTTTVPLFAGIIPAPPGVEAMGLWMWSDLDPSDNSDLPLSTIQNNSNNHPTNGNQLQQRHQQQLQKHNHQPIIATFTLGGSSGLWIYYLYQSQPHLSPSTATHPSTPRGVTRQSSSHTPLPSLTSLTPILYQHLLKRYNITQITCLQSHQILSGQQLQSPSSVPLLYAQTIDDLIIPVKLTPYIPPTIHFLDQLTQEFAKSMPATSTMATTQKHSASNQLLQHAAHTPSNTNNHNHNNGPNCNNGPNNNWDHHSNPHQNKPSNQPGIKSALLTQSPQWPFIASQLQSPQFSHDTMTNLYQLSLGKTAAPFGLHNSKTQSHPLHITQIYPTVTIPPTTQHSPNRPENEVSKFLILYPNRIKIVSIPTVSSLTRLVTTPLQKSTRFDNVHCRDDEPLTISQHIAQPIVSQTPHIIHSPTPFPTSPTSTVNTITTTPPLTVAQTPKSQLYSIPFIISTPIMVSITAPNKTNPNTVGAIVITCIKYTPVSTHDPLQYSNTLGIKCTILLVPVQSNPPNKKNIHQNNAAHTKSTSGDDDNDGKPAVPNDYNIFYFDQ